MLWSFTLKYCIIYIGYGDKMRVYNKDDIVIRTYEEEDIQSIISLYDDKNVSEYNQTKFLLLNINNELDRVLTFIKGDQVIGLVDLMAYYDKINIVKIIIDKEYQGKGYDKLLIDTVKAIGDNEDRDIEYMGFDDCLLQNGFQNIGVGLRWKHTKKDMGIPKIFIDKEAQKNMNDDINIENAAQELYRRGIKL